MVEIGIDCRPAAELRRRAPSRYHACELRKVLLRSSSRRMFSSISRPMRYARGKILNHADIGRRRALGAMLSQSAKLLEAIEHRLEGAIPRPCQLPESVQLILLDQI
jgi:hypothetical protein